MTDTPEDEKLIERLARAACETDGLDPNAEIQRDAETPSWVPMKKNITLYRAEARRHLAMRRELERARDEVDQDKCDHDFYYADDTQRVLVCVHCGSQQGADQ